MTCCTRVAVLVLLQGCTWLASGCREPLGPQTGMGPSPSPTAPSVREPDPVDHRQPFAQLEGVYQMAFVAEGCTNGFAPAYRTPTYTARLEQVENRVTVVLPDVPPLSWFPESPRLWGLIGPEHLSLTNYMGNEQWFGLFEQKSPTRLLSILVDEMTLTGSSERLSGAFAGAFLLYEGSAAGWPHVVDRCSSTDHGVTLTRVPGR